MADSETPDWSHERIGREEVALAVRRAYHGFIAHRGIDSAAALAFFAALAVFPISLTVVSAVALWAGKKHATSDILRVVADVSPHSTVTALRGPLHQLLTIPNPGYGLAIGIVVGIWTLSNYGSAVGRTLNTAYDLQEGRRWFRVRATMLLVAAVLLVIGCVAIVLLLGTPSVALGVAQTAGVPAGYALAWDIAKWPVLAALAILAMAILYFYSPVVRHLRIRWVTSGALLAIVAWAIATTGFAVYVLNFSHYNRIYGWLGGAIVLLLWLYLSNLVVVAGAETDSELVRIRQLRAGIAAETIVRVPLRSTARIETLDRWEKEDRHQGLLLRNRSRRLEE